MVNSSVLQNCHASATTPHSSSVPTGRTEAKILAFLEMGVENKTVLSESHPRGRWDSSFLIFKSDDVFDFRACIGSHRRHFIYLRNTMRPFKSLNLPRRPTSCERMRTRGQGKVVRGSRVVLFSSE